MTFDLKAGIASGAVSTPPSPVQAKIYAQSKQAEQASKNLSLYLDSPSFNLRLEKHLDDVKHGQGYLSSDISSEVWNKDNSSSAILANSDPSALKNYSAYQTVLGYDKKARYITAISDASNALAKIPSKEEAKAASDEIIKAFYPDAKI